MQSSSKKQYLIFVNDHSWSMDMHTNAAMEDFNKRVDLIKTQSDKYDIDIIVSVVQCGIKIGYKTQVTTNVINSSLVKLKPMTSYDASGDATPLYDSIARAIEIANGVPDFADPNVSFVIQVTTDGGENSSRTGIKQLNEMINKLNSTDRATFIFRIPKNNRFLFQDINVSQENIIEWNTNDSNGLNDAYQTDEKAYTKFYDDLSKGATSSKRFYANASTVKEKDLKENLTDISSKVKILSVGFSDHKKQIRDFCTEHVGQYKKGSGFYQLTKSEDKVQGNKIIAIRDKKSGKIYAGDNARVMIGIPISIDVKLSPGQLGDFDVFIQSTSVNRSVYFGTSVLYWEEVGVEFKNSKGKK